jgi:hypothetical protein
VLHQAEVLSEDARSLDYIGTVECQIAKKRHNDDEIEVVPVLVHHPGKDECAWLMALQRVPPGEKSWAEVAREFGA